MGILDDLQMGLGLKEKTDDYRQRTARTAARRQGSGGQSGSSMPVTGSPAQAKQSAGGGGKGGRPNIDPSAVSESGYNKDDRYGYYAPDGTYVSAFMDMRDGGGKNQSGNYFVGGGMLSSLLNIGKVRPAGAAREMRDGEYVVPISDIGYRDLRDMYDRGGPQASGGAFQGGGRLSALANLGYGLTGGDFGTRRTYAEQEARAASPRPTLRPQPIAAPTQDFSQLSEAPDIRRSLAANYYSPQVVPSMPEPEPQSITTTSPMSSMGMTLDEYIRAQGVPVNEFTKNQYLQSYLSGYGM